MFHEKLRNISARFRMKTNDWKNTKIVTGLLPIGVCKNLQIWDLVKSSFSVDCRCEWVCSFNSEWFFVRSYRPLCTLNPTAAVIGSVSLYVLTRIRRWSNEWMVFKGVAPQIKVFMRKMQMHNIKYITTSQHWGPVRALLEAHFSAPWWCSINVRCVVRTRAQSACKSRLRLHCRELTLVGCGYQ